MRTSEKLHFPIIDLSGVQNVLIDIDNTLYIYEPAHQIALRASYNFILPLMPNIEYDAFEKAYTAHRQSVVDRLSPQGACRSRLFGFQSLLEEHRIPSAYVAAHQLENIYWDTFIDNMTDIDGARNFLEECTKRQIPVCAVTDMQSHFQVRKLQQLKLDHLIQYMVTSEEFGAEKPDKGIFTMALKKMNAYADSTIMIGDHPQKDIAGAEAMGIKAYLVEAKDVA